MKILHVYKAYYPVVGGIENHVRALTEAQAAAGHEVTVLVTHASLRSRVEWLNGVRVIRAGRLAAPASTPLSLSLPLALARERPDITHLQFPYPVGEVAQWLFGRGRPCVLSYQSDVVRQRRLLRLYRPAMQRVLASVDRILVSSPNYLESSSTLQPYRHKCTVVPLGIDQRPFLEVDGQRVQALRERYGPGPLLLFTGVLRYYKGLSYLLEAMPSVRGTLLVVGEGPMGDEWRAQAEALGLGARVVFVGAASDDDLPAYYRAADLFVLPASERSEAYGLVLVEALTSGLPAVTTELGSGTSYVNRHGETGLVVPPRDAPALARAINALLGDDALRERMAANARVRSAEFALARMVAAVEGVYHQLLAEATRAAS